MKLKKWLTDNKIFFDTIFVISLTFMSIMVSLASNKVAKDSVNLQVIEQLPYFVCQYSNYRGEEKLVGYKTITTRNVNGTSDITKEEVYGYVLFPEYLIINKGGNIRNATLDIGVYLIILDSLNSQLAIPIHSNMEDINYDYIKNQFLFKPDQIIYTIERAFFSEIDRNSYSLESDILIIGKIKYYDYLNKLRYESINIEIPNSKDFKIDNQKIVDDLYIPLEEFESDITPKEILDRIKDLNVLNIN
jgi:hypothetical protein